MDEVLIRTGNLVPSKTAQAVAFTLAENIYAGVRYMSTTSWIILLGRTRCWAKGLGAPVEKTPATPFTYVTDPMWTGCSMMTAYQQVVVVNNSGFDKPHYWDGGAGLFLPLTAAPLCKCIIGYLGRLVCGAVYDDVAATWCLNRVQWSDENDITTFSLVGTSGYEDLRDEGDLIQRLSRSQSNVLRILRNHSVWVAEPTLDAYAPITLKYLANRGIMAPNTLQHLDKDTDAFLGEDDVYLLGDTLEPVGWKVRKDIFKLADPARKELAWSFVDELEKEYYVVVDLADGTTRAWILNWESMVWSQQDLTGYTCLLGWYED